MERRRIIVNFKNTVEDIQLYEKIKNHSSISGYVKDILKGLINNEQIKTEKTIKTIKRVEIDEGISDILSDL